MNVRSFINNMKNMTTAITFLVCWNGYTEVFTKEQLEDLVYLWGAEPVKNYFMVNTREMMINIA